MEGNKRQLAFFVGGLFLFFVVVVFVFFDVVVVVLFLLLLLFCCCCLFVFCLFLGGYILDHKMIIYHFNVCVGMTVFGGRGTVGGGGGGMMRG